MSELEIFENLKKIFSIVMHTENNLDKDPSEIYLKDLGVNSIGLVYFSIAIEETFKIDMSDVTFTTFKTVQDVINYIKERV